MAHLHNMYDSDIHFKLDSKTRTFSNETDLKLLVAQGDHNSERITFEIPRYIEQHDMLKCNRIEIHYINISSTTRDASKDVYIVEDAQVSPEDENVVEFSWLLSGRATQYNGTLSFAISMKCLTDEVIDYRWNTLTYEKILVGKSLNNAETIAQEYSDVLEKWKKEVLENINPTVTIDTELNEESDNAIANSTVAKKISQLSDEKANKTYVDEQIAKAQLEGAGVDTSQFVTKDDLNNLEAGGLTQAQITLFEQLFNNLAYTDNVVGKATADSLIASLRQSATSGGNTGGDSGEDGGEDTPTEPTVKTYTITNSLTNATTDNNVSSVEENTSYTATITPNEFFIFNSVMVTMGGVDVTSTVYSDGVINIPQVTGDVIIMVTTLSTKAVEIYSLPQATTYDGSQNAVDTGIKLFEDADQEWSICIDVECSKTGSEQVGSVCVYLDGSSAKQFELSLANWYGSIPTWYVKFNAGRQNVREGIESSNHLKIVMTKPKGLVQQVTAITSHHYFEGGTYTTLETKMGAGGNFLSSNGLLIAQDGFKGTIHDLKIYNGILTQDEINEYLGV